MDEVKKPAELEEGVFESVTGGAGVYAGMRITTALSKCGNYSKGSNYWNRKVMGISNTCGMCSHFCTKDGWQLCDVPNNY